MSSSSSSSSSSSPSSSSSYFFRDLARVFYGRVLCDCFGHNTRKRGSNAWRRCLNLSLVPGYRRSVLLHAGRRMLSKPSHTFPSRLIRAETRWNPSLPLQNRYRLRRASNQISSVVGRRAASDLQPGRGGTRQSGRAHLPGVRRHSHCTLV